jgi:DNA invertase Pin-like site-specific DNA recombinase
MKALILARVSTKDQEDGQSIPAQERRLLDYAREKGLIVEQVYKITESSKHSRKEFDKVIERIRKSKEPLALIADTIDRVQRSFRESVILEELRKEGKIEIHFYRERLVLHPRSNSSDLLRWDMGVMFARGYVLQLSDNIIRSKEQAAKSGMWIGQAPIGYRHSINEQGNKTIVSDPVRAPLIRRLFEMYATGNYSLLALKEEAEKMGLRTKKGQKVAKSQIDDILKNPFYCSTMNTKYGIFQHRYESLISPALFHQVQNITAGFHKKPFKALSEPFVLRGLVVCAHCGCLATPEIKKKRYVYYSCTNAKGNCKRIYVREEPLIDGLAAYFDRIALSQEQIDEVTGYLKEIHDSKNHFQKECTYNLKREQERIQKRLSQMYDDKFDGLIDEGMYLDKTRAYKARQAEILEEMGRHNNADKTFYVTANVAMNLAARSREIFMSSEVAEKRQILNLVFQNFKLDDQKNLILEMKEPFLTLMGIKNGSIRPIDCPAPERSRTNFSRE